MCGLPALAIAAGVVGVARTAVGIAQQSSYAKAQNAAINSQLAATNEEARIAAGGEIFDSMRAMRREQGRIRAAAGEAGLSLRSGSVEGLLFDSAMQAEMRNDRALANQESRQAANVASANSAFSQVDNPSTLGAGLQLGSAMINGWSGVEAAKIKQRELKRWRS